MTGLARILLLALPILASSIMEGRAEIFRFTEPDGTVHYSNVPVDYRYRPFALPSGTPFSQLRTLPPDERARLYRLIDVTARDYRMDPALIRAVVKAESDYNPRAISSAGALGLMQLMPGTARDLNVKNPFDPEQNVKGGVQYLRYLLDRFEGSVPLAVAAYHAGERTVVRHDGIPPIAATQAYVKRVMAFHKRYLTTTPTVDRTIYKVRSGDNVLYTTTPPPLVSP